MVEKSVNSSTSSCCLQAKVQVTSVYTEESNDRARSTRAISSWSFVVLALLHWLTADVWVCIMYGYLVLVTFGSGFLPQPHVEKLREQMYT